MQLPIQRAMLEDALVGLVPDLDHCAITASISVQRGEGDAILLRGAMRGAIQFPCTRCLSDVDTSLDVPLQMLLSPKADDADEAEEDEVDPDVDFGTYDGVAFELDDLLREALILGVPMVALCRPDCKGLCGVCGGDRNERDCACEVKLEDPRLAPLKGLKV